MQIYFCSLQYIKNIYRINYFRVNFKKLRPRAPLFKDSKVFQELQKEATAEPPLVQELKRNTTFLQRPERPIPKLKSTNAEADTPTQPQETYKVVIKKQTKKSITDRLVEKGLLEPGCVKCSEQRSEVKMFVPSWSVEADTQSSNIVNSFESSKLVNSETININDSVGITNSAKSSESSNVLNSCETLINRNSPESISNLRYLIPKGYKSNLESSKSLVLTKVTSDCFLTMNKCGLICKPKRLYMRNRYFENYFLTTFLLKHTGVKKKKINRSKLYRKGRYLTKIVNSLTQPRSNRKLKMKSNKIIIRGHYVERYLVRKSTWAIAKAKRVIQRLFYSQKRSSNNFQNKGRYIKRILTQYMDTSKVVFSSVCDSGHAESCSSVSSLLSSLSNEIFHRGCKKLWSKYRSESGWIDWLKNLSGISLNVSKKFPGGREMLCNEKPLVMENLNDTRRLSFVPTVLFDGLTNCIGVDFTRVVVYALVPCASMVLLYAYK